MKWSCLIPSLGLCFLYSASRGQVNPQNGAAQLSIPLYNYSDSGNRLGLSATLNYLDGNGLKVSEIASAVGTGWNLDCGGVITRIQHGEPDDQYQSATYTSAQYNQDYAAYLASYFPSGYLYTSSLPTDNITNGGAYSPYYQGLTANARGYLPPPQFIADRDQDIFQFSFNGRSGQFVIGKNLQAVTLLDSKLSISFQQTNMSASGIRTMISQFTITDETGIQYIFKDLELAYVCNYTDLREVITNNADIQTTTSLPYSEVGLMANSSSLVDVVLGVPNNQFIVSKWYLSEIVNPFTGAQITFNYTTYEEDINAEKTMNNVESNNTFSAVTVFWTRDKFRGKRLSGVTLSPDEQLTFNYSSSPRIDLPDENALSQLQVSYKGSTVYTWNFNYGYMVGIDNAIQSPTYNYSPTESQWSRLCLTSLQRTGLNNISENPYQFAYNMGGDNSAECDVIPPMFSIYQDFFGYYNAGVVETTPSEGSMTSFYPISSLNTFVTNGLNNYRNVLTTVAKNGIIKSVTYPLGGTLTYTYENNSTPSIRLGGVRVNQTTLYDGVSTANNVIKQYKYLNSDEATSSGWGGETYTYTTTGNATAIGCTTKESPSAIIKDVAAYIAQQAILSPSSLVATATFATSATATTTLGTVATTISDIMFYAAIAYDIYQELQPSTPPTVTLAYTVRQTGSLTQNNPLPWGYSRTEVIDVLSSGTTGKTVYTFSDPNDDRPIDYPTLTVPYSNKPRCASWTYGLPKTITVLDNNGKMIKQTVNNYTYIVNTLNNANFESKSWVAIGSQYNCPLQTTDLTSTLISQETYYPFTGHVQLNNTSVITYNSAQQSTSFTTNYDYDNNFQLKDQYFNNSKGEKVQIYYYYPYNYSTATGGIGTMNIASSNIFGPLLSTETYLTDLSGNTWMVKANAVNYGQLANGDFKPQTLYTFQSKVPVSNQSVAPFNPASVVRDPNYYIQIASYGYDNYGNLCQAITGGNRIVSSIYDYAGKLQIASAINAAYSDIAYTSFEAEGGKPGSTMNSAAIVSTDSRTGNSCFNLSNPSNATNGYFGFSGLNSALSFIVSFWSKNGTPCLTGSKSGTQVVSTCQGASGWIQGATVNGWTYYEVQVNNIDKISVSGTGLIDEFRIYPVGAQMKTASWQPLVGKTSECDVSGKVTYYQYDELGRLRFVLDDQKNIIRMYDYNYIQ